MNDKDMKELFDGVEIAPREEAKQKARARMLAAAENREINIFRKIIMESERITRTFKFNKYHMQGAVAALLVAVIAFSALVIAPGTGMFGAMFRGYEDAREVRLSANPSIIEADMDFFHETFTLTGLPENEIGGVRPEHIFLDGYFGGMSVVSVEASHEGLNVTLSDDPDEYGHDAVDWQGNNGWNGLIAITPEAFRDRSFHYLAEIDVIYPRLSHDVKFLDYKPGEKIEQAISLGLVNDAFTRRLTESDITVDGGITNGAVKNLRQGGASLSFVFTGDLDESLKGITLTVNGDALEKGFDLTVFIQKGFVPSVRQSSSLFVSNQKDRALDIFVHNDTWSGDFNLSMLAYGGVMNNFDVTGFEIANEKTLRLFLSGRPNAGTGTVRFEADAFETRRGALTARIDVTRPEIYFKDEMIGGATNPEISFNTNIYLGEQPDLHFELGGVLAGMTASLSEWRFSGGALEIQGTPRSGRASVKISGLFEAAANFTIEQLPAHVQMDHSTAWVMSLGNTSPGIQPLNSSGLNAQSDIVNSLAVSGAMTVDSFWGGIGKSVLSGILSKALGMGMDAFFNVLGIGNPSLTEIMDKLNAMHNDILATQSIMIQKFAESNYTTRVGDLTNPRSKVASFTNKINVVSDMSDNNIQEKNEAWRDLLNLSSFYGKTDARTLEDEIDIVLNQLDPYLLVEPPGDTTQIYNYLINKGPRPVTGKKSLKRAAESQTLLFLELLKTNTPFKHNVTMLMNDYTRRWEAELMHYAYVLTLIYDFNAEFYPDRKSNEKWVNPETGNTEQIGAFHKELIQKLYRIDQTLANMREFLSAEYPEYPAALRELTAVKNIVLGENTRGGKYKGHRIGQIIEPQIHLITNRNGRKYFMGNKNGGIYSVSYNYDFDRRTFFYFYEPRYQANNELLEEMKKDYCDDLINGANSLYELFRSNGKGGAITFNQFMQRYTDGAPIYSPDGTPTDKTFKWWNPNWFDLRYDGGKQDNIYWGAIHLGFSGTSAKISISATPPAYDRSKIPSSWTYIRVQK